MDVRQLQYFVSVAEKEHISKAAESLYISQPTLSLAIRRLENELGVSLFDRTGRNIKLNEYGRIFYAEVKLALEHIDTACRNLAECKGINDNRISIISPSLFMFQGMMDKIYELYPNVLISRIDSSMITKSEEIAYKLISGDVDICITMRNVRDSGIETIPLKEEQMYALVSRNHPLAGRTEISLTDLTNERFVANMKGSIVRECLDNLFAQVDITPNIAYETYSDKDIWLSVASGKYISVVPSMSTVGISIPDVIAIPIDSNVKKPVLNLYYHQGTKMRAMVMTIVRLISAYFTEEYGTLTDRT